MVGRGHKNTRHPVRGAWCGLWVPARGVLGGVGRNLRAISDQLRDAGLGG